MSAPHLLYEKRDGVAYVTMNRPERHNALSPEMLVLLAEAWRDFREDGLARVAILTGAGERAFSSGADLGLLIPLFTRAREPEDEWDRRLVSEPSISGDALLRGFELYKPVISAVNGYALAGGTEIMLATDLRIAADHASFGLSEAKRALIPAGGSLVRLPRQVPYAMAMEILLTGDPISASDAHRIGLVNCVVPGDEVLPTAERLARTIAENGPLAVRKIKEAVIRSGGRPLEEAFTVENECASVVMRSEDAKEGPLAFMEKRKPVYKGM